MEHRKHRGTHPISIYPQNYPKCPKFSVQMASAPLLCKFKPVFGRDRCTPPNSGTPLHSRVTLLSYPSPKRLVVSPTPVSRPSVCNAAFVSDVILCVIAAVVNDVGLYGQLPQIIENMDHGDTTTFVADAGRSRRRRRRRRCC